MKKASFVMALVVTAGMTASCAGDQRDENCEAEQASTDIRGEYSLTKGGGGGGGGGKGGGGGSSGGARGSQGGGGSSAKGTNSASAPKASSKPYGSYTRSSGYYAPYYGSDGSYGYWDDTDTWNECDPDTKKKKKRK